jgi:anthranilate phosphoribosyltransferase
VGAPREDGGQVVQSGPATTDWTKFIKEVGRGAHGARDLAETDAHALFGAMLDGVLPELELGAVWIAYRIKGESLQELLGFCRAVASRTAPVTAPSGPLPVVLPSYNGARRLPNMTPLLALLLARQGVPALIHGPSGVNAADAYGRTTTASILQELGIAECAGSTEAGARLAKERLAYVPLKVLAPGLARLVAARARIGVRSSAHTVAKLLDPFRGKAVRVVPVTHPDYLTRMGAYLAAAGTPAVLLRGSEGEPYAHPRRMPALLGFAGGEQRELQQQGEHEAVEPDLPQAIDVAATAQWTRDVLAGSRAAPATLLRQVERISAQCRDGLAS